MAADTATMNVLLVATQKASQPQLCFRLLRHMQEVGADLLAYPDTIHDSL